MNPMTRLMLGCAVAGAVIGLIWRNVEHHEAVINYTWSAIYGAIIGAFASVIVAVIAGVPL